MTAAIESDVTLKDGTKVHLRPIRPEDGHLLVDVFHHLSPQSVYQRFFTTLRELTPDMARHFANVNYTNRFALVAEAQGELIAVGRYEGSSDPDVVELSLVVVDPWQNRGLGRVLLRETMRAAESNGIHKFRADILADNRRMLKLIAEESQVIERSTQAGVATLIFKPK